MGCWFVWFRGSCLSTTSDFRNGVTNLMLQSFDSSPPKQLTKFTKEQFYSFDFSSDGRVLLSRGFWTNDVVLISEAR
jgi:hypothetical protein